MGFLDEHRQGGSERLRDRQSHEKNRNLYIAGNHDIGRCDKHRPGLAKELACSYVTLEEAEVLSSPWEIERNILYLTVGAGSYERLFFESVQPLVIAKLAKSQQIQSKLFTFAIPFASSNIAGDRRNQPANLFLSHKMILIIPQNYENSTRHV
jgi:hypothetical protein